MTTTSLDPSRSRMNAQPGDALPIDILMCSHSQPHRRVAETIWDFDGVMTSSRNIKGVTFCGRPHCGVIGTAPSEELLQAWVSREGALNDKYRIHGVECAQMPTEQGAYVGQDVSDVVLSRIKTIGARTKPAREHGGNIDWL